MPPRKRADAPPAIKPYEPTFDIVPAGDGAALMIDDESFLLRSVVPGAVLLDFMGAGDNERALARVTYEFFGAVIVDDLDEEEEPEPGKPRPLTDLDRFNARIRDPRRVIEIEPLFEIAQTLVQHYSGRPTESPRRTAKPRRGPGGGSTASRSSRG